ncbi:D-isomer specific 2-hydroxyacid dehydrogenase family protein [Rhizobium sp. AG855]|uniref:NAD(P)-dependent oxidoreductase n=1 Tax=Rhizobium sp. AG855 TaxID=2183898 RepID=UPI000E73B9BF|nr:D-isomer specific 2-hydroxyacid dehydrogenase family protein [Rhizobium sp. AG855]RKE85546.1 D-3-phosphoglycerate dehydrogenase/(S)-sulfolactate dehydrogenase [Rhizobium sp. AG855]
MDILINEPEDFPQSAIALLEDLGRIYRSDLSYPKETIAAVFVRLRERIGEAFLAEHPSLRYVISPTTGLNHLDIDLLESAGVTVLSLKGKTEFLDNIHATSELTLAITLGLLRNLRDAANSVLAGEWNRKPYQGSEIFGKTVLIVGYGRLGRQAHRLFEAFGAKVIAAEVVAGKAPSAISVSLPDGLAQADIVSLHVNLDDNTEGFFGRSCIEAMKPGAVLINTARGELIDQAALFDKLIDGHIAGAALDVLWNEPQPISEDVAAVMRSLGSRLLVTPHIGGLTWESLSAVEEYMARGFVDHVAANGTS